MNTNAALSFVADLMELETISQSMATPEDRWQMLQNWLKTHPKWKKRLDDWLKTAPNVAASLLLKHIADEFGVPSVLLSKFLTDGTRERITSTIEMLQTLYKERARLDKLIEK